MCVLSLKFLLLKRFEYDFWKRTFWKYSGFLPLRTLLNVCCWIFEHLKRTSGIFKIIFAQVLVVISCSLFVFMHFHIRAKPVLKVPKALFKCSNIQWRMFNRVHGSWFPTFFSTGGIVFENGTLGYYAPRRWILGFLKLGYWDIGTPYQGPYFHCIGGSAMPGIKWLLPIVIKSSSH